MHAMTTDVWLAISGTTVIWFCSACLAVMAGILLAAASLSNSILLRTFAYTVLNVSRGVPTSILVIGIGLASIRLGSPVIALPIFPGTPSGLQHVAWAVVIGLSLGSVGHLAAIFRTAALTLSRSHWDQARVVGLSTLGRVRLIGWECLPVAIPPLGSRMVHHLHNTAFAAFFPVLDLFGVIHSLASSSYRVLHFALLGTAAYIAMSFLIWLLFFGLERHLLSERSTE